MRQFSYQIDLPFNDPKTNPFAARMQMQLVGFVLLKGHCNKAVRVAVYRPASHVLRSVGRNDRQNAYAFGTYDLNIVCSFRMHAQVKDKFKSP